MNNGFSAIVGIGKRYQVVKLMVFRASGSPVIIKGSSSTIQDSSLRPLNIFKIPSERALLILGRENMLRP